MDRNQHASHDTDAFGSGKHGYKTTAPYTALTPAAMNQIQEELARAIEGFGVTLDSGNMAQLSAILLALTNNVTTTNSATPVFGTNNRAADHPSSASNKWKLWGQLKNSDNTFVRIYSGAAPGSEGCWAVSWNAVWDPSSGAQTWSKDNTGLVSSLLLVDGETISWRGRATGAGSWATSSWSLSRGDIRCSDITTNGPIVGGTDITAGDDLIATDKVVAGAGVDLVSGEVAYLTPPSRTIQVPVTGAGQPADPIVFPLDGYAIFPTAVGGQFAVWPLLAPHGATITKVEALVRCVTTAGSTRSLRLRTRTPNFASPATPVMATTAIANAAISVTGGGAYNTLSATGSVTIDNTKDYLIELDDLEQDEEVHSIRVTFTDPGPRNF